jgi:APA family basic amino acid/polyamine antiporter
MGQRSVQQQQGFRVPGHPVTTLIFIVASWLVVANAIYRYPKNTLIGIGILLLGVPVYFAWARRAGQQKSLSALSDADRLS